MTLTEKLNNISNPKLPRFENGHAHTVKDYWYSFILPRLPRIDIVIKWHEVLKEYIKIPDAVLAFRTGNVKGRLRRGWETKTTEGYSFFYTDNYFSHYFYKLAHDGDYEPNVNEFYNAMKDKKFPVRISSPMGGDRDPHEREYAAHNVKGKNPGINISGYKLAHIIDAGQNYAFNNKILGLSEICNRYFDLGEVSDWKINPITKQYCRDNFDIPEKDKDDARKLAEISFLRMVHPMNYFLSPKSRNKGKTYNKYFLNGKPSFNIAEEAVVLSYVRQKFHERYTINNKDYFKEFLDLVFPVPDSIQEDGSTILNIEYSPDDLGLVTKKTSETKKVSESIQSEKSINTNTRLDVNDEDLQMAWEYLTNPNTSFRKIEKEILKIDSPARGGGFKSKTIINALGITAGKKGVLSYASLNEEIADASGQYKRTLELLKRRTEER